VLKRSIVSNYLSQGWNAFMGFAFIPLYIKYLGIEAYGIIGIFTMLQSWFTLLDMGMLPTLSREMALFTNGKVENEVIRDLLRSIEIIIVTCSLLFAVFISFSSEWIALHWLREIKIPIRDFKQSFVIMSFVTASRFIEGLYRSALFGLQKQVQYNSISIIISTLRGGGVVIVLKLFSPTLKVFFLWQGVVSVFALVILASFTYRSIPRGKRGGFFSISSLRRIWKFASGVLGVSILGMILTQLDKILLSKLLSLSDFGLYTLASNVASLIFNLVAPITTSVYPKLCKFASLEFENQLGVIFHKGAQLVTIIVGSAAVVLMYFSETFLQFWTNDFGLSSKISFILCLMTLGNLLNSLNWVPHQTQLAYGWTKLSLFSNIFAISFVFPAIFIFVPKYGLIASPIIWILLNIFYIFFSVQFMFKKILTKEKINWYYKDIFLPLLGSILAVSFIYFVWPSSYNRFLQALCLLIAFLFSISLSSLFASKIRPQIIIYYFNVKYYISKHFPF